jgi:hypothetical protein
LRRRGPLRAEPTVAELTDLTTSNFCKRFGAKRHRLIKRVGEARVAEPTEIGLINLTTSNLCKRFGAKRQNRKVCPNFQT